MVQYPKDLLKTHPYISVTSADAVAIYFTRVKAGTLNILQTSHCLEAVRSGSNQITSGDETGNICTGQIQFRKRGNYQQSLSENYSSILFFVENEFIADFLKDVDTFSAAPANHFYQFQTNDHAASIINHVYERVTQTQPYAPCIVRHSLQQLFFQLLAADTSRSFVSYLRFLTTDRKTDLAYFMETNYLQALTLADMAKLTGRSLTTFKKDFAQQFNLSPFRWLINRRLQYAHHLLKSTEQTIAEIAYQSGFKNASHFSKCYRSKYNSSPTAARAL